jgi:hypothetical protein
MPAWYETFTREIAAGEGRYLACEACGEASLPPRRVCPACGSLELSREPLSDRGTVLSFTEISVTIPKFHGEAPYTVVMAELGDDVVLSGQLREATADDIAIGDRVVLGTETRDDGPTLVTFHPAQE